MILTTIHAIEKRHFYSEIFYIEALLVSNYRYQCFERLRLSFSLVVSKCLIFY